MRDVEPLLFKASLCGSGACQAKQRE